MDKRVVVAGWCVAASALSAAGPLEDAPAAVCGPTFELATGPNSAGTAFVLAGQRPGEPGHLVTAHHLFGPDGGVEPQLAWDELPRAVQGVRCEALAAPSWAVQAGPPRALKGARSYNEAGQRKDIAVFTLSAAAPQALRLAPADPKVGDVVWLVARVRAGAPPAQLLHRARVLRLAQGELVYAYDNPALKLGGTSGAPVVDDNGRVVAVNFGAGRQDGQALGFGTARRVLADSLAALR